MTRQRPWRADHPDAIIVARPTIYGNPFRISSTKESRRAPRWWHVSGWRGIRSYIGSEHHARRVATDEFEQWITTEELGIYDWHRDWIRKHTAIRAAIVSGELAGRDVACWCPLDQPCHGDIILKLANGVTHDHHQNV